MSAEATLGPLEIGVLLSSVVFGVTCLQCHLYFVERSANDPPALKCLVAVLMALETIYTVSLYHILYFYSVQSFGDVEKFGVVLWSFVLQRFVSCFLCTITQCFFAIRVYYLNGHRLYTPILISITSMLNITSAISVTVIGAFLPKPFTQSRIVAFGRVGTFTTLIPLSGDVIITTSTVYHLQKTRIQTIGTDRAIYKLIMYTLNTGLLITLFALMSGISTFVQREMFTYAPFDFVLSRLYACSLISVLNSRAAVQRELAQVDHSIGSGNNIFTSVAPDVPILATTSSHA